MVRYYRQHLLVSWSTVQISHGGLTKYSRDDYQNGLSDTHMADPLANKIGWPCQPNYQSSQPLIVEKPHQAQGILHLAGCRAWVRRRRCCNGRRHEGCGGRKSRGTRQLPWNFRCVGLDDCFVMRTRWDILGRCVRDCSISIPVFGRRRVWSLFGWPDISMGLLVTTRPKSRTMTLFTLFASVNSDTWARNSIDWCYTRAKQADQGQKFQG